MNIFGVKNIFTKILVLSLFVYFRVSADGNSTQDAFKELLDNLQTGNQKGFVRIVEFVGSVKDSLDKISEEVKALKVVGAQRHGDVTDRIALIEGKIEQNLVSAAAVEDKITLIERKEERNSDKIGELMTTHTFTEDCGGLVPVLPGHSSTIRYPNGGDYYNNERCIWTLSPQIKFDSYRILIHRYDFESCCDGIIIYYRAGDAGLQSRKITSYDTWNYIPGPYVMITFCSDHGTRYEGFQASIVGVGSSSDPVTYKAFWFHNPSGNFLTDVSNGTEIVTVVVQPEREKSLAKVSGSTTNTVTKNEYCLTCLIKSSSPNYQHVYG